MTAPILLVLTGVIPPKKTSQKIITPRRREVPLLALDPKFKRKRIIISSDIHREWQESASWELKVQKEEKGLEKIDYKINLGVVIMKKSRAEFDLSNAIQSIEDALELAGVIENDNLIYSFDGSGKILGAPADGAVIKISRFKRKLKISKEGDIL